MKYYGKRYLYNFLKEHGYEVPQLKDFRYEFCRGTEWLKTFYDEIDLYSPERGVIYVTLNEIDDETGKKTQVEYSKYKYGILNYQKKRGKITVIAGKPYKK